VVGQNPMTRLIKTSLDFQVGILSARKTANGLTKSSITSAIHGGTS
jgi:hypothetical protein